MSGEKYEITFVELPLVGSSLTLRMTVIYLCWDGKGAWWRLRATKPPSSNANVLSFWTQRSEV